MYKNTFIYKEKFGFEAGGEIEELRVAYHSSSEKYEGQKVVWICHALTADSNPEEWWPELVGESKLFDTQKYFVVCGNMLGSCYGSSGPSSIDPKTGKPYFLNFPKVTVRDIARSLNMLREYIGIEKIDLLVGVSIGGFQALEYSIMYPEAIKKAVFIATLSRVTPWLTAFEWLWRRIRPLGLVLISMGARRDLNAPEALRCFHIAMKMVITLGNGRILMM